MIFFLYPLLFSIEILIYYQYVIIRIFYAQSNPQKLEKTFGGYFMISSIYFFIYDYFYDAHNVYSRIVATLFHW